MSVGISGFGRESGASKYSVLCDSFDGSFGNVCVGMQKSRNEENCRARNENFSKLHHSNLLFSRLFERSVVSERMDFKIALEFFRLKLFINM